MVEQLSPLAAVFRPGSHGNFVDGVGVTLSEMAPGSIVQLAAWPGEEKKLIAAITSLTGLKLADGAGAGAASERHTVFGFAPGKFLLTDTAEGLVSAAGVVTPAMGTITDLSHGRTAIRIAGPRSEWVLAKLFAVDFSLVAFPQGSGISTAHHDIFAQIQRSGPDRFDLYVFRSFARSLWKMLCHASDEVGYEVR
ncbi:sarcosine oxidase subunit gamma [Aminobacter sp. DSM 101952]|uniref:sarcosine oxidase subunit gamma family protein n=1 Tax=Aminobacter sp. DSM 101952 TaxID=2735891 RepID=UPI0006F83ABB|nr:sarcosine oxidase subunit gamma family protein [Aminobacter sp. DSM 101952]KQU76191.1 sarcosine oxidase subunit gamma [Aminobacter sp. DSM 101952]